LFTTVLVACGCLGLPSPRAAQRGSRGPAGRADVQSQQDHDKAHPDVEALDASRSELRSFIQRYVTDRGELSQLYAVRGALAGGPGRFAPRSSVLDYSPAAQNRLREFYGDWLARLKQFDFEALSQDGKIDYLLLNNHLTYQLRQLDLRAKKVEEAAVLVPFAPTIVDLKEAQRLMQPVDPAKAAATLNALTHQVEKTRKAVEAGLAPEGKAPAGGEVIKVKKTVANRAAAIVNNLRTILSGWFSFYDGYDPSFTWWESAPYKAADQALEQYAKFLREKVVGIKPEEGGPPTGGPPTGGPPSAAPVIGDPVGREALLNELNYEMIPYTPEELIAIANQEFAWCEKEMKRASADLGYGDDWKKALEHVKEQYVEPGQQPDLIRKLMFEAVDYVKQHDLVTVPPLAVESLRMEMMSPQRQLVNPFFLGGEEIIVSYPTNTMTQEQKMMSMRGNNIHFARATVLHEMIPGHHLQFYMSARYRPYREVFETPFWSEGYALYWETMFWDLGFPKSPEDRIGMLFWRMHRCARIIFSLSFHLEKMSAQECIDFLVNRVGHERDNATAEVRRSFEEDYSPLYQCAYMLGALQLRALHHEVVDNGKMNNRAFHDAVFKENSIPIEMIRASLTHQLLTRDFAPQWKFYRPHPLE
jgi:uncharacterized protein (DUF885 family)